MTTVDLNAILLGTGVISLGSLVFLVWLAHHEWRVGRFVVRMEEQDAALLGLIAFAFLLGDGAAHYVLLAKTGGWTAGDFRATQLFVDVNLFILLAVAPLLAVAAIVGLWRRHSGKR